MAGRRSRLFRQGGRVAHEFSLPTYAAHVHVAADGRSLSDYRHNGADAADSGELPLGNVSAQPRRADAGNGDR